MRPLVNQILAFGHRHCLVSKGRAFAVGAKLPAITASWRRAYELVFFLDPRSSSSLAHRAYRSPPSQSWALSGFVFAFPLLLVGVGITLVRRWSGTPPAQRSAILLLLSILLWVLAATLLVDGSEANRIRFPTEPYLLLLGGWLIASRRPRDSDAASRAESGANSGAGSERAR